MRKMIYTVIVCCLLSNLANSQVVDAPVKIRSFSIDINAGLSIATTTVNIELFNPNNKVLDGEYNFSLGNGQVITGFALDINGSMREGVIVDKQKGRVAYENTIRRRIDPGLLEMTTGDNYRVRVYPMPANGTRKIRIIITEQLSIKNSALVFALPLDVKEPVSNFELNIKIAMTQEQPLANEGMIQKRTFLKQNDSYALVYTDQNIELKKPVSFRIPIKKNAMCFLINGVNKYFVAHVKPAMVSVKSPSIATATVFWDVSGSGTKRNIEKELSFLEAFCRDRDISQLTVVSFSNAVHEARKFNLNKNFETVKKALEKNIFDGGTQLGILDCSKYESDAYLLFSDGISNYGESMIKTNSKPVYCISSSPSVNHSLLKKLSDKTSGRYIDLNNQTLIDAIAGLSRMQNKLLSAKTFQQDINLYTQLPLLFEEWVTVCGIVPKEAKGFELAFGDMGMVTRTENISFEAVECDASEISSVIMLQQFAMLQNQSNISAFATMQKLVTASTSFIVLDNLDDYIQWGIEPPADLEDAYLKRMGEITQKKEQDKRNEENALVNNLRTSVSQYNQRVAWWNKNEPLIVFDDVLKKNNEIRKMAAQRNEDINASNSNRNNTNVNSNDLKSFGNGTLTEVVVTSAFGMRREMRSLGYSTTVVSSSQLSGMGNQNVIQALAGRVPGLQIIDHSAPGSTSQLFIRGGITSPQGGEPLFILDGSPVDGDIATLINMNEVESVSVLKGVQASILYGSRASNGAIVITRRKNFGSDNRNNQNSIIRYKDLEDADYISALKDADKTVMYERYLEMKDTLSEEPSFFFDAAEILYYSGEKEKALRIITNLLEMDSENHQLLRAVGYMFEYWGMYKEAISVYRKVLEMKEEEPQSYRDLALTYEKDGNPQAAIELLYGSLTKNWGPYENRYNGLRSMLLTEMNTIIKANKEKIDLAEINSSIIKPLPVDLRIVVDWNKDETDVDLHIIEPNGEECYYSHRQTKAGGRMAEDFTQGYGPEEYQIKNAGKGRYSIQVNYYGDSYQKKQVPSFIKLTIYKNYGRSNQTVTTETLIMDNQTGKVEIGSVKF